MALHVITLDGKRHRAFLEEQRRDPVTKEFFRAGDRVVICAACRSSFLESSWRTCCGSRHCGQTDSLRAIEVDTTLRHFSRQGQQGDANARAGAATPPSPPPPPAATAARGAAMIELRGVPVGLTEIPVRLRPHVTLRGM
jgi:hypothetical protein